MIFSEADRISTSRRNKPGDNRDLIDTLIHDPMLARLYWAIGRVDRDTQESLRQSPGLKKLYPLSAVLDFYGSHIQIRSGRVIEVLSRLISERGAPLYLRSDNVLSGESRVGR